MRTGRPSQLVDADADGRATGRDVVLTGVQHGECSIAEWTKTDPLRRRPRSPPRTAR